MNSSFTEVRAFNGVVVLVLLIPLVGGLVGAFGGLEGMAYLFGTDPQVVISPLLRNNFRALCIMFFAWVPLAIWTLAALPERAGAFRIAMGCAFLAGFARLTGYLLDGFPGVVPVVFMAIELAGMPILLLWHARLVRQCHEQRVSPGAVWEARTSESNFGIWGSSCPRLPSTEPPCADPL
jgi:uncharacterized protein DUF4345